MTDISWSSLRTWEGTRQTAFEKLCTQLAMYERSTEDGSRFIAKGNPDAGVECYWKLPDGREWGWQAKFFTVGPPSSSQWTNITNSFKKALEKHSELTKYYVCIPMDRADPRNEDSHFMDKWEEHVKAWAKIAREAGREVEFVYWGTSEIFERLAQEEHRGRRFFWFNEEYLDAKWFANRLEEEEAAEPRYTPEVDVDLPIVQQFDALGRTEGFERDILDRLGAVRRDWHDVARSEESLAQLGAVAQDLARAGEAILESIHEFDLHPIDRLPWDVLREKADALFDTCKACESGITKARDALKPEGKVGSSQSERHLEHELYSLRKLSSSAYSLTRVLETRAFACANEQFALLRGRAGAGKTHLLFDVARGRLEQGLPTVVLLGKHLHEGDPWTQIRHHLQVEANRETLLGALEAAAQAAGRRAMILIDAINEGGGRKLWRGSLKPFLTTVRRFPWVLVVFSIRTTYEKYVVPPNLGEDELMRIDHHGFEGIEYEATEVFFQHFKIQTPTVPLLHPEFSNPLFLKLLCQGMQKASLTKIPKGFRGISRLFQFFVESANKRLAESLDYPEERNLVDQALRALAAKMLCSDQRWLSFDDAESVCQDVLHRSRDSESLCRNLIHEGLLRKECSWFREDNVEEGVMFAYERLADHLVAAQLLEAHVDPEDPRAAFALTQPLGFLAKSKQACWRNRGLIEAMSIQLPEEFGLEFAELFPDRAGDDAVVSAFLESIGWRSSDAFSEATRKIVNTHVIKRKQTHDEFLRILLRAAPDPEHPYNADFLHKQLLKYDMPHRGSWWSMFLHEEGPEYSAVARLIDWAWTYKGELDKDSLVLYGTTLAWFLTTPNRYVRDRATKALVNLFTNHLAALQPVLERFIDVDDPYVLERLLATAYGAALRTRSPKAIRELALTIYKLIFQNSNPPVHILSRDYARGVIEYAIQVDATVAARVDLELVRPPYASDWDGNVPSVDELKAHPAFHSDEDRIDRAGRRIAFSILDWGDFGRHIINTGSGYWSTYRRNEPRDPSPRELVESFEASLTLRQAEAWGSYRAARRNVSLAALLDSGRREELLGDSDAVALESQLAEMRERFLKTLREKKRRLFEDVADPYLDNPTKTISSFDPNLAQRWILNRVIELGWSTKLHGKIDAQLIDEADWRSQSSPAERIGKKYQWIAYRDFLARVADNFEFMADRFQDVVGAYDGPWQVSTARDIDPSVVLQQTGSGNWGPDPENWWFPVRYTGWRDHASWLRDEADIPRVRDLIEATTPGSREQWLALDGSYNWEEPTPAGEDRHEIARGNLSLYVHGYLIRRADVERATAWARGQDFSGAWMPEAPGVFRVFNGEYHWSQAYKSQLDETNDGWYEEGQFRQQLPCPVMPVSERYSNDGSDDLAMTDGLSLRLPNHPVARLLGLSWAGRGSDFVDEDDILRASDPSAFEPGPSVLLFHRDWLEKRLDELDLSILWTVSGEKLLLGGRDTYSGEYPGRLVISGFALWKNDDIASEFGCRFDKPT